jgi:hypothetical protein
VQRLAERRRARAEVAFGERQADDGGALRVVSSRRLEPAPNVGATPKTVKKFGVTRYVPTNSA